MEVNKQNEQNKLNVLIAIQNGIIALDIKNRLEKKGFKVTVIIRKKNISILESSLANFQLIIMDSNGLNNEFSAAAKLAESKDISIVYLKTFSEKEDDKNSAKIFLLMPFNDTDLFSAVEKAIKKYSNSYILF